jgi:hypothetical protein
MIESRTTAAGKDVDRLPDRLVELFVFRQRQPVAAR